MKTPTTVNKQLRHAHTSQHAEACTTSPATHLNILSSDLIISRHKAEILPNLLRLFLLHSERWSWIIFDSCQLGYFLDQALIRLIRPLQHIICACFPSILCVFASCGRRSEEHRLTSSH